MNVQQPICKNCGNTLEPDWQFCENCGSRVATPSNSSVASPPPPPQQVARPPTAQTGVGGKKSKNWLFLLLGIGCLVIICICLLAAVVYFYLQGQNIQWLAAPSKLF